MKPWVVEWSLGVIAPLCLILLPNILQVWSFLVLYVFVLCQVANGRR